MRNLARSRPGCQFRHCANGVNVCAAAITKPLKLFSNLRMARPQPNSQDEPDVLSARQFLEGPSQEPDRDSARGTRTMEAEARDTLRYRLTNDGILLDKAAEAG